jgi:hypothetical protein
VFAVFRSVLIMSENSVTYLNTCVAREKFCVARAHESMVLWTRETQNISRETQI